MAELTSMTDFVLEQKETETFDTSQIMWYDKEVDKLVKIRNYANFLKQPLEIWMFVPCKLVDGVWKPLKEPKEWKNWLEIQEHGGYSLCHNSNEYQKSLDKVLFEGIKFADVQPSTEHNYYHVNGNKIFQANNQYNFFPIYGINTIEDLVKYKLTLTPSAEKQIGL